MNYLSYSKKLISTLLLTAAIATTAYAKDNIKVAIIGEADTLDPMMSTKDIVSIVTQHFVETLYTFDSSWSIVPLLAEDMPKISDDGKIYTIGIRQGITFHDGSSMDAKDVLASLNRWVITASRGKEISDKIASIEVTGDYEITIKMKEAYAPLLSMLAFSNSAAAIYPEEIIADRIENIIGTGPYQIKDYAPDQYLQLTKFENYISRSEPSDGPSGQRLQLPDEIHFIPVPDPNTRVEGLISGQFDFADGLPAESYDRILNEKRVEPVLLTSFGWPIFAINHKKGLLTDLNIRKALQAALPHDDMLFAAFGDDNFFLVDGPLYPEGYIWRNDAATELYNQNDQAKAAAILKQAGYDGTPLRILTSRQYEFHFKMAEVAQVALEAAGFKVQMDVVDWATLGQRRNDPDLWDIYITHSPFLPEPTLTSLYSSTSRLGWANKKKEEILTAFTSETDIQKRIDIFADLQRSVLEDVGFIKIGGFSALQGKKAGIEGITQTPWPFFWNAKQP